MMRQSYYDNMRFVLRWLGLALVVLGAYFGYLAGVHFMLGNQVIGSVQAAASVMFFGGFIAAVIRGDRLHRAAKEVAR